jgi:hypothetical protein
MVGNLIWPERPVCLSLIVTPFIFELAGSEDTILSEFWEAIGDADACVLTASGELTQAEVLARRRIQRKSHAFI